MTELPFYASPGVMTDLTSVADAVEALPTDIAGICEAVHGLVLHPFWAERYGVGGVAERDDEMQIRPAADIIAKALEIDDRPLSVAREPGTRVLGNCRDFTTITVALLRRAGVPARGRCGFGAYFSEGLYEDHWVAEWWDGQRWVFTDAQLDDFQVSELKATFDPLDVPRDQFIDAGRAWQMYRSGEVDGDRFGLSPLGMKGPWFIRGNMSREVASLNKVEMLPWDGWGMDDLAEPPPDDYFDAIASVTATADFDKVRALYATDERMRVPDVITSYLPSGPVQVRVFD